MSIEQVESAILALSLEERRRLLVWFEEHQEDLFGAGAEAEDLTSEQKSELLRRRQEYTEHPERFSRMDEKSVEENVRTNPPACCYSTFIHRLRQIWPRVRNGMNVSRRGSGSVFWLRPKEYFGACCAMLDFTQFVLRTFAV